MNQIYDRNRAPYVTTASCKGYKIDSINISRLKVYYC